jgi:predicted nucleotidyltransferase
MRDGKVLGIIAEYNPFHNGHLYHLQESIKCTSADFTVCAMSGNFVQRGEPAIVNKWARTKMALLAGVDLVVEIPVIYATASAEFFAHGGIKILNSLGVVDYLSFGSEIGQIAPLNTIAEILIHEPKHYKVFLKKNLDSGLSYPAAMGKALHEYLKKYLSRIPANNDTCFQSANINQIMNSSNNILGIEYLKALKRERSNIIPVTVKRKSNLYTAEHLTGAISSATAIRKHMTEVFNVSNKICRKQFVNEGSALFKDSLKISLPLESVEIIENELNNGRGPVLFYCFENIILATIRKMQSKDIRAFPNVREGLENRIKNAAENSATLDQLIENICTRRYTRTRIQRILLHLLLNITAAEFQIFNNNGGPQYIRVLGFNKKGAHLLSRVNKIASLPVIVKTADYTDTCNSLLNRMLEIEALSTDIYVLGYKNLEFRKSRQDFTNNPVLIK